MKKLFSVIAALVLCTTMWGISVTDSIVIKGFAGSTTNEYVTSETLGYSARGVAVKANQYNPNNGQIKGNKSTPTEQFNIYNTLAFPGSITLIQLKATGTLQNSLYASAGTSSQAGVTTVDASTMQDWDANRSWKFAAQDKITYFRLLSNQKFCSGTVNKAVVYVTYEVPADTLYLNTGGSTLWNKDGAKFSAYYWNDGEVGEFTDFLELAYGETDIYRAIIPKKDSVIFVRHNATAVSPSWDNKDNQTKGEKVDLEDNGNMVTITGWEPADREWDRYTPKEEKYYVTGNAALLDGTGKDEWAADAIEMVDGSYTFTNLAAGDYLMKVTKGDWKMPSYGYEALSKSSSANIYDKDGNIRFVVATPGDVKVDYADGEVTVTGTFAPLSTTYTVVVPAGTPNCFIAGSFDDWKSFTKMDKVDETHYTLTLDGELKDSVYKYTCGKDWKYVEDRNENRTYSESDEVSAWKKVPGATFADTYTSNISEITGSKLVFFGDTVDALKAGASKTAGSVKITIPAGTKTLHFHALGWKGESVTLTVDGQEYKLNSNDGMTGNSPFTLTAGTDPENDYYTFAANTAVDKEVTITTSAGNRFVLFGVNAEGGYVAPKYYIAGTMTKWADEMVALTLAEEDSVYRTSLALEADSLYEYKVVRVQGTDSAWYGLDGKGTMKYGDCTGWWVYDNPSYNNIGLQTTLATDYAFAVDVRDIDTKIVVSVVIPEPQPTDMVKVASEEPVRKFIKGNRMYINVKGVLYNAAGMRIK